MSDANRGSTQYHRPGDRYRCGMSVFGRRCEIGPDHLGGCHDNSCRPILQQRWWLRHFRALIGLIGISVLVAILSSSWHRDFLAPGPLTQAHGQILKGDTHENRCAACHGIGQFPAMAWIAPSHPIASKVQGQSELCIQCHLKEMPGLDRKSPHDLPIERLAAIGETVRKRIANAHLQNASLKEIQALDPVHWKSHPSACSDCHREHQGAMHDLTKISSERCQSCHLHQFASFSQGHPEFDLYPVSRDSNIAFSHANHRDRHFAKENAPFDCRSCHVSQEMRGAVGQVFRSLSFEQACARCHEKALQASVSEGMIVFQIPSLDRSKLVKKSNSPSIASFLSDWPEAASQSLEGSLPPIMQILLASDEASRNAIQKLPRSGNYSDLDLDRQQDRETMLHLATASKQLLKEIALDGQGSISKRLGSWLVESSRDNPSSLPSPPLSLETPNADHQRRLFEQRLLEGIPPDIFRTAFERWFATGSGGVQGTQPNVPTPLSSGSRSSSADASFDGNLLENSSLNQDPPPVSASAWKPKPLKPIQHLPAGGWMVDDRRMAIVYIPNGHADPWVASWTALAARVTSDFNQSIEKNDSGWQEKENMASLRSPGQGLLEKTHVGRCMECHQGIAASVPTNPQIAEIAKRWRITRRSEIVRESTRFDHGPHLLLPSLDCVACHRLPEVATNDALADNRDQRSKDSRRRAGLFVSAPAHPAPQDAPFSEFVSMKKSDCSQCHRPNAAGENCTQCHNYHVGGSLR